MTDRYSANAFEAERLAAGSLSEAEKRVHLEVAALWHELAIRKAERRRSTQVATETPPSGLLINVDEERSRVTFTVSGGVDAVVVADLVCATFNAQPRVTHWDMIYELTHLTDGVGAANMDRIAAAYLAANSASWSAGRTAIVALSPFYQRWTDPLSRQFRREHRAFATVAEAEPFLAEPMANRAPPALALGSAAR